MADTVAARTVAGGIPVAPSSSSSLWQLLAARAGTTSCLRRLAHISGLRVCAAQHHHRCRRGLSSLAILRLRWPLLVLAGATCTASDAVFGKPKIAGVSAHCAAVEFEYKDGDDLHDVFIFAKRPDDPEYIQWGDPLKTHRIDDKIDVNDGSHTPMYRTMIRNLPADKAFQIMLSSDGLLGEGGISSPPSDLKATLRHTVKPPTPQDLQLHRTDPRHNLRKHDDSVCIDVHWSHTHPKLKGNPHDIYFRIDYDYIGEHTVPYCEDEVGHTHRNCGVPIQSFTSDLPSNYATMCNIRPKRRLLIKVVAFNCDGESTILSGEEISPPSSPTVITSLITVPANQESVAGFRPMATVDWIPQHDELILGHAVYLGLRQVNSMKLLCWVPHNNSAYAKGHLEMPIVHMNQTYAEHSMLLHDFRSDLHVHQEQQLLVATRIVGHLESPAYSFALGEWRVQDMDLKCLTAFDAVHPGYVTRPITLAWTQAQAMALYD